MGAIALADPGDEGVDRREGGALRDLEEAPGAVMVVKGDVDARAASAGAPIAGQRVESIATNLSLIAVVQAAASKPAGKRGRSPQAKAPAMQLLSEKETSFSPLSSPQSSSFPSKRRKSWTFP